MTFRQALRLLLLPWAALLLFACGASQPPPENPPEDPPETVLTVTWNTEVPQTCRNEEVLLSVSITGGTPSDVALYQGESRLETLVAPYAYTLKCYSFAEDMYSLVVKATVNGRHFQSPEKKLLIDRTPPRLTGWRPKSRFPAVGEPLELVFSEPLDPRSLGSAPITLRKSGGFSVAYQSTLSEDGSVLRIVPTQPLLPPMLLGAELIQKDLKDRAGNVLGEPSSDVRLQSFQYWPFAHVDEGVPMDRYVMLNAYASAGGQRVAAWVNARNFPEVPDIQVARWTGQAWEPLQAPISESEAKTPPRELAVAMTNQHQVVLAWLEENKSLHVKRFDGAAWQPVGSSPNPERGDVSQLRLALDQNGVPLLAWQDLKDIHVARWDGFSWNRLGGPVNAHPQEGYVAQFPSIVARTDHLVLAWCEPQTSELHVWEYRGGAWSPIGQPLRTGFPPLTTALTLDQGSAPVVAWVEQPTVSTFQVGFSRVSLAGAWDAPERVVESRPMRGWVPPTVLVDERGSAWVSWAEEGEGNTQDILYRRRGSSGWGPEQLVGEGDLLSFEVDPQGFPRAAVGVIGNNGGVVLTRPQ